MAKEMILYYLTVNREKKGLIEIGPYVAQIISSYVRGVTTTDEQVIEYVQKMHGTVPARIERINLKEEKND